MDPIRYKNWDLAQCNVAIFYVFFSINTQFIRNIQSPVFGMASKEPNPASGYSGKFLFTHWALKSEK